MAMTPEAKVKAKCVKHLKEMGAYYFYPSTHGYGRSGIPDIVVCYDGLFIGIECKANGNKTTPLQERELNAIDDANGMALVIDETTVSELRFLLETHRALYQLKLKANIGFL